MKAIWSSALVFLTEKRTLLGIQLAYLKSKWNTSNVAITVRTLDKMAEPCGVDTVSLRLAKMKSLFLLSLIIVLVQLFFIPVIEAVPTLVSQQVLTFQHLCSICVKVITLFYKFNHTLVSFRIGVGYRVKCKFPALNKEVL